MPKQKWWGVQGATRLFGRAPQGPMEFVLNAVVVDLFIHLLLHLYPTHLGTEYYSGQQTTIRRIKNNNPPTT